MSIEDALKLAVRQAIEPLERKIDALTGQVQELRENGKPADPNEYLLLPKAAIEAGKHPDTLRRAIKAKKLKASRPAGGREWSVRREDLVTWLSGGRSSRQVQPVDDRAKIADAIARMARKAG